MLLTVLTVLAYALTTASAPIRVAPTKRPLWPSGDFHPGPYNYFFERVTITDAVRSVEAQEKVDPAGLRIEISQREGRGRQSGFILCTVKYEPSGAISDAGCSHEGFSVEGPALKSLEKRHFEIVVNVPAQEPLIRQFQSAEFSKLGPYDYVWRRRPSTLMGELLGEGAN